MDSAGTFQRTRSIPNGAEILAEHPIDLRATGYVALFASAPAIGSRIVHRTNGVLTLVDVEPYTRVDGRRSAILTWQDEDGHRCTTGLKSKGVRWIDSPEDQADGSGLIKTEEFEPNQDHGRAHRAEQPRRLMELVADLHSRSAAPFDRPIVNLEEVIEALSREGTTRAPSTQELGKYLAGAGGGNLGRIPVGGGQRIRLWSTRDHKIYDRMTRAQISEIFLSTERPSSVIASP